MDCGILARNNPDAVTRFIRRHRLRTAWWKSLAIGTLLMGGVMTNNSAQATEITGIATVIDGDTIDINGHRIRLHGIDAPESRQLCQSNDGTNWKCGQMSTSMLREKVEGKPVSCRARDIDRYGRTVAQCVQGKEDINAWMVASGWAVAYRRYSMDYVALEEAAKINTVGIWASRFVMPWDWRRGKRMASTKIEALGVCAIKGNISRAGKRIFHVPGGRWYERTTIDEDKGERWFCSEEEAETAGWRKSSQ
jgi:endonuclease YncB( thermonuclease family)